MVAGVWIKYRGETPLQRTAARRHSYILTFIFSFDEFEAFGLFGGFVGLLPLGGGGEFGGWGGLALFQEAVGAEDDAVGIPEPNEAEAADGFELEEAVAEGIDLLFVLGESVVTGIVEEFGKLGEFVWLEVCGGGEEVFGWAVPVVCEEVDAAGRTGLVEDGFHGYCLTCGLILQVVFSRKKEAGETPTPLS